MCVVSFGFVIRWRHKTRIVGSIAQLINFLLVGCFSVAIIYYLVFLRYFYPSFVMKLFIWK